MESSRQDGPWAGEKLRGVLACAARGVRRVLPLAVADVDHPLPILYEAAIGVGESFALAEPGDLRRAERLHAALPSPNDRSLRSLSGEDRRAHVSARAAATWVAEAALRAYQALAAVEAMVSLPSVGDGLAATQEILRLRALEAAWAARVNALAAAGLDSEGRPDPRIAQGELSEGERVLANVAFCHDLTALRLSSEGHDRAGTKDWLGAPVDPGEDGPVGPLWPVGAMPRWYRGWYDAHVPDPQVRVMTGGDFAERVHRLEEMPDLVCWHLAADDGVRAAREVMRVVAAGLRRSRSMGAPAPSFVVHAPELDAAMTTRMVEAGATVLDRAPLAHRAPENEVEVSRDVVAALRHGHAGWDMSGGLWAPICGRQLWRDPGLLALASVGMPGGPAPPAATSPADPVESWSPSAEVQGSADYRPLLEQLATRTGWPAEN
jgi:hypothetical protein